MNLFSNKNLLLYIILWYFFSGTTLFLNKYTISYQNGDAMFIGVIQLFCCSSLSYIYLQYRNWFSKRMKLVDNKPRTVFHFQLLFVNFFKFAIVGALRLLTVSMALIALWYIPVSFAEIIKSSAPIFTVFISTLILYERTSMFVILSLLPIMIGLSLCSAYEIHFNFIGFCVALFANLSECLQNVLSKRLLTNDKYEANQIQLFTSFYSILLQIPYLYYFTYTQFTSLNDLFSNHQLWISYILSGISFHFQSLTEYALLSIISPVSHSVANTVKRAVLIWLSVIIFHNPVTFVSWLGTILVIFGVFLYNKAKEQLLNDEQSLLSHKLEHIDSV